MTLPNKILIALQGNQALSSRELPSGRTPRLVSGNYFVGETAVLGLYPELYQVARWNRVLTEAEMVDQYASSKALFAKAGI